MRELDLIGTPRERRFDRITDLARAIFGVRNAQVTLLDDTHQFIKSHAGPSELQGVSSPLSDAICTVTIQEDRTFVVEDASLDERFRDMDPVRNDPSIRFYAGHPLESGSGLRLGALCIFDDKPRSLTDQEAHLLRDLALLAGKELEDEQEIVRAVEVQRSLLPTSRPVLDGYTLVGDCTPARGVGGDFFDWRLTDSGVQITLADVMGKGVGAAIVAATVRAVMVAAARRTDLESAMTIAAETLADDLDSVGAFVTVFSARLDTGSGELRWVDAGHGLAMVLRSDGTTERLSSDDHPLGIFKEDGFTEHLVQLHVGDRLVVASDGVLDLYDGSLGSLDELASEYRALDDPADALAVTMARAAATGSADDVSVVILQRDARPTDVLM